MTSPETHQLLLTFKSNLNVDDLPWDTPATTDL